MKTIDEKNRIIADFMGIIKESQNNKGLLELNTPDGMTICPFHDSEIRYDENWNWLMTVVDKIENTYIKTDVKAFCWVEIAGDDCSIIRDPQHDIAFQEIKFEEIEERCGSKIKSTFEAVLKFVEWYK